MSTLGALIGPWPPLYIVPFQKVHHSFALYMAKSKYRLIRASFS
jgi:hypothetical protein